MKASGTTPTESSRVPSMSQMTARSCANRRRVCPSAALVSAIVYMLRSVARYRQASCSSAAPAGCIGLVAVTVTNKASLGVGGDDPVEDGVEGLGVKHADHEDVTDQCERVDAKAEAGHLQPVGMAGLLQGLEEPDRHDLVEATATSNLRRVTPVCQPGGRAGGGVPPQGERGDRRQDRPQLQIKRVGDESSEWEATGELLELDAPEVGEIQHGSGQLMGDSLADVEDLEVRAAPKHQLSSASATGRIGPVDGKESIAGAILEKLRAVQIAERVRVTGVPLPWGTERSDTVRLGLGAIDGWCLGLRAPGERDVVERHRRRGKPARPGQQQPLMGLASMEPGTKSR